MSNEEKQYCWWCDGRGYFPSKEEGKPDDPCIVCRGTGKSISELVEEEKRNRINGQDK